LLHFSQVLTIKSIDTTKIGLAAYKLKSFFYSIASR